MDITSKILENMPHDLSDLEKARYIYLELCKLVSFSTKFHNTDDITMAKMFNPRVNIHNLKSSQVNCVIWSIIYSQLLDIVGIRNEIVDMGHQWVKFYIDNEEWLADATLGTYTDLARIKNNDETVGFGKRDFRSLMFFNQEAKEMIDKIDQKFGYNASCKQSLIELKEYLMKIHNGEIDIKSFAHADEITKENELSFKLEHLFAKVGKLKPGFYEQKDFIYHLESIMLSSEEMSKVGAVELKKTNFDKSVDIVQCIYVPCGNKINYYLLAPNIKIQKYEEQQIIKLAMMGYGIEHNKQIPGFIYPRYFQPGKVSGNYRYRLYNFLNNMKLIPTETIFTNLEEVNKIR